MGKSKKLDIKVNEMGIDFDRAVFVAANLKKRKNCKIDQSKHRLEYIERMLSRWSPRELAEYAESIGDNIDQRSFRRFIDRIPEEFFYASGDIDELIKDRLGVVIDDIKIMDKLIRYQEKRLDTHAKVDVHSPIARREQSNDIKLLASLVEKRREIMAQSGLIPTIGRKEETEKEGKKVKSIDEYNEEEQRQELLRIAKIELQAEESRKRAEREGRFDGYDRRLTGQV